ncbi:MAG: 4-alpha-glucanotransferase, partial [Ilumatobacteraceae bacterium]
MHDRWGIADGYHDVAGYWHPTDTETRALLRAAIGEPSTPPRHWFVHQGSRHQLDEPCQLIAEDGTAYGLINELPGELPCGYHILEPVDDSPQTWLVVHPPTCLEAPYGWGVAAQVYSLWGKRSWGIGDLDSVIELAQGVATAGGTAVLMSPLHAPAPTFPQQPSPYYPSSRRWLNPLLIPVSGDPPEVIDNERGGLIDRDSVWRAKRQALATRFAAEQQDPGWRSWARAQGRDLWRFCTFGALADEYGPAWSEWPVELRHPDSPAVADRALRDRAFGERLDFHAWCQWVAHRALERAAAAAGCALIGDLAVGSSPDGADAWSDQDMMAMDVQLGAPPDPFNTSGQAWGLPPFIPWRLREARYEPFIAMVRAAMHAVGGLRIDHVMGLFRLFWIPSGKHPSAGAYVQLPAAEMLAIICLEAHRAGVFVVGEDLGTVQPEVRAALSTTGVLGTKVWLFDSDVAAWPPPNLATVTTHDLPTVAGVLAGLGGTDEMRVNLRRVEPSADAERTIVAVHAEVARSPARLVIATLDDLAGSIVQPNHPGTIDEFPNWRMRMSASPTV